MRTLIVGAAFLAVAGRVSAQDPFTNAKRVANKAAAATNAHIAAEQRPDAPSPAQPQAQPAPATTAAPATHGARSSAPVRTLTIAQKDTTGPTTTIMRESYDYSSSGRRDPFVSLLSTNELRPSVFGSEYIRVESSRANGSVRDRLAEPADRGGVCGRARSGV